MVKRANREAVSGRVQAKIADLHYSGFTDAEIGRRLGVNRSTVGRWGKGQTIPTDAHRRALYGLFRRAAFPRYITSRVVREVVKDGEYHPPPLFIQPVSAGRIPHYYKRHKVYGAYVVVNAWVEWFDGDEQPLTMTIGRMIPNGASLNNPLLFDGIEAQWRQQILMLDGSKKIKNYTVIESYIRLRLPEGMMSQQFQKERSR